VALARALVADPALVLADEPTGNLDLARADEIIGLLEQANARGSTVLVASHDTGLWERFPHPVWTLREGRLQCAP
jgi:cell division transport system ATP-binding protein